MSNRMKTLKIYDAIASDDYVMVRKILNNNIVSLEKIPTKDLCGLLIMAAERNATNVANEFIKYNILANDSKLSRYICIAKKISYFNINRYKTLKSKAIH